MLRLHKTSSASKKLHLSYLYSFQHIVKMILNVKIQCSQRQKSLKMYSVGRAWRDIIYEHKENGNKSLNEYLNLHLRVHLTTKVGNSCCRWLQMVLRWIQAGKYWQRAPSGGQPTWKYRSLQTIHVRITADHLSSRAIAFKILIYFYLGSLKI